MRLNLANQVGEVYTVCEIAIVKLELWVWRMWIFVDVIDAGGVEQ